MGGSGVWIMISSNVKCCFYFWKFGQKFSPREKLSRSTSFKLACIYQNDIYLVKGL